MNLKKISVVFAALLVLGACKDHEKSITGAYGNAVVTGQVTMAADVANNSPAGVVVSVGGTGMTTVLGADGRFTFAGVPDGATLRFTRAADGISAATTAATGFNAVELSKTSVTTGSRRRSTVPQTQIEGTLAKVAADSIDVQTESHGTITVALNSSTVIRKGHTTVAATDLKVGDQVHVQAMFANNTYTATQVILQAPDDDTGTGQPAVTEIEGTLTAAAADSITVLTQGHGSFTVALTSSTVIRKGQTTIAPADLKVGYQVHVKATSSNNTYTAIEVIVQNTGNDDSGDNSGTQAVTANGTVSSLGTNSLVVHTASGKDVTVNVDDKTIIRKYGQKISFSDIKVGDQVESVGTAVDSTTILATQIEVQNTDPHGNH